MSKLSFSYRTFDPQSMVIFGFIGARFMPDFRFEKLCFKLSPWKSILIGFNDYGASML